MPYSASRRPSAAAAPRAAAAARGAALVLATWALGGCAHAVAGRSGAAAQTPEGMYQVAVEDMVAGLYPEASRGFDEIKVRHPYSRYAALAELRLADTHLKRGKFIEAIDAYRSFLKFHPHHEDAPYALFQVGEAYFDQLPHDWFFLPPGAEKDAGQVHQAIAAYRDLLSRFGDGPLAATAQAHLDACRRRLADHEMYVARFYFKRQHPAAAVARAGAVLESYGGLGLDIEALWIVARAELAAGHTEAAVAAARRLVQEHPDSREAALSRTLLTTMGQHTQDT